jgi:flagellar biosynthesis/type III secretory pathway M-ring protein FliF/YscJ
MLEKNFDIPLHDIKPIVEVQEYSLYYFILLVAVALFLVVALSYLVYKYWKKKSAYNKRKDDKKILDTLSFENPKETAYAITLYGATFSQDSARHQEMYQNLLGRLEKYKYKKIVESIDEETRSYYQLYKEMCDV